MTTATATRPAASHVSTRTRAGQRPAYLSTAILLIGAVYALLPVLWVLTASTKHNSTLFTSFTFKPEGGLVENIRQLSDYRHGLFWTWMWNTALYAGGGALLSAFVSGLTGYTLAKYRFRGKAPLANMLLAGVLVPPVVLAVPQYLLVSKIGLANTYWSVLIPSIISPYGIYLARIYAAASVPTEIVESARMDGAGETRTFATVAIPMMLPGLVTIFLFQFVAIWNNFLLPFIMLSDDKRYPLTVGLYTLLNQGANTPTIYTVVITGALLSILPLIVLFFALQRYWRVDLASGAVKG